MIYKSKMIRLSDKTHFSLKLYAVKNRLPLDKAVRKLLIGKNGRND